MKTAHPVTPRHGYAGEFVETHIGFGLGGMGFSMSVFIAALGFANQPEQLVIAKAGILSASNSAGIGG